MPPTKKSGTKSTQESNKQAVIRMNEAFNTGQLEVIDELLADSHTDHGPSRDPRAGAAGIRKKIGMLRQAFPDLKFTIEQIIAEGDVVAFRWKMVGTQSGEFVGYQPSHKPIEQFGHDFVTFKDGKIVTHYSATDSFRHILEKLGHEPRPREARKALAN
jgi:predicted ester cyclase